MSVNVSQRGPWRALLQRGLDTAADVSDLVARKISAAADPRARLLRRRRRALRWAWIFTAGSVFWGLVTAVLAAWRGGETVAARRDETSRQAIPKAEAAG